jgi:hypothetical protein
MSENRSVPLPLCKFSKAGGATADRCGRRRTCPLLLARGDAARCPCKDLVVIDHINAGKTPVTAAFCLFPRLRRGGTIEDALQFSVTLRRKLHPV